ncbi:dynein axonemal assembly factor 3-like isoform X2 [Corythoichthys intestinalis]|uniref:dynein axonemal assembly factor 3-like isoform X2 n=1 Tax=Corythoichthys intestinalis TaxID=161448 RepID=UPI0025A5EEAA|nr:dynein axonemal assembly factor 3-like isoform X2 [Corythoichthys intestinalis]
MSAGRPSEGAGCINWWGFSPARDLISAGPVKHEGKVNILLVGNGDPRHLLKTLAGLQDEDILNVWLFENCMEVVARQMLLLYITLTPHELMGLNEKTEMFLEVFGNSVIRGQTDDTVKRVASQLLLHVSDIPDSDMHPCFNTALLKFRERDELARIFKSWVQPLSSSTPHVSIAKAWDYRVRQHLGTRYDAKRGCFDWDLTMKLYEKGCGVINKHQYFRWRESGLAFELREGVYQNTNPSLLSSRVFNQRGDKVAMQGYWGDIASSPYLAFGIETEDESLLKTRNGQHVKTAQDISFANVQELFQSLSRKQECTTQSDTEDEHQPTNIEHNSVPVSKLTRLKGVSVNFLPLDSLEKMAEKGKYAHFFHIIHFSTSCAHHLGPKIRQIAAPDAVLIVELAKYILDLNKEQEAGFAERVSNMCQEAGFQPCVVANSDDLHAVFQPHKDK